ncbi:MAG: hypothetical protein LBS60_11300 [Deltaproteobacteria bacterium]|jgi:hypothetical protein|nr:hypothetical protein [Deltaproteobacteria bacterium]
MDDELNVEDLCILSTILGYVAAHGGNPAAYLLDCCQAFLNGQPPPSVITGRSVDQKYRDLCPPLPITPTTREEMEQFCEILAAVNEKMTPETLKEMNDYLIQSRDELQDSFLGLEEFLENIEDEDEDDSEVFDFLGPDSEVYTFLF